jgi:hypothetical protein
MSGKEMADFMTLIGKNAPFEPERDTNPFTSMILGKDLRPSALGSPWDREVMPSISPCWEATVKSEGITFLLKNTSN